MVYKLSFGYNFGCDLYQNEKLVLDADNVCDVKNEGDYLYEKNKFYTKTHSSDWTIIAKLKANFNVWVEIFTAYHPFFGKIVAVLNRQIISDSKEAWIHFKSYHKLEILDLYNYDQYYLNHDYDNDEINNQINDQYHGHSHDNGHGRDNYYEQDFF